MSANVATTVAPRSPAKPQDTIPGGLTTDEAASRLTKDGPNAMPDTSAHPFRDALGKFWAPVPWLLEAAIGLQVVSQKYFEASVIAGLLLFNAALAYFQEGRAQATLAALKSRLALNASVRRDGAWRTVLLGIGLIITGHAVLTPMLMVIIMITGDFLAMSLTTDRVRPSEKPNAWKIGSITSAGVILGGCFLAYCTAILVVGKFEIGLGIDALRTLCAVSIVYASQATLYAIRGRHHLWGLRPTILLVLSSVADLLIISTLALRGMAMAPLAFSVVASEFAAAIVFRLILVGVKIPVFTRLEIS